MKFSQVEFSVGKREFLELQRKQRIFQLRTRTKKTIFPTMITTHGLKPNPYAAQIPCQIRLEDMFWTGKK